MTESNPLLSLGANASQELAAALDRVEEEQTDKLTMAQLSEMNTDEIKTLAQKADSLLLRESKYTLGSADEVRTMLDLIKGRMSTDERFDIFDLAQVTNYVKSVMITLRTNPEFDTILLDEDVHALFAFAQSQFQTSAQLNGIKVESEKAKSTKAASKRAVTSDAASKMASAMDALLKSGF